jgi:C-terminal processing protease CtpA/Prc
MIGNMMKFLAPLLGLKPNFEVRPRGFLGIEGEAGKACFVVLTVLPDSPADKAGIKKGDKIRSVGGKDVEALREIQEAIAKHGEGEKVKLKISRDDKMMDLDMNSERAVIMKYLTTAILIAAIALPVRAQRRNSKPRNRSGAVHLVATGRFIIR